MYLRGTDQRKERIMELVEIQRQLQTFTGTFPRQALQAAIAHKEEITLWPLQGGSGKKYKKCHGA